MCDTRLPKPAHEMTDDEVSDYLFPKQVKDAVHETLRQEEDIASPATPQQPPIT